ncbi:adenine phosphoribosyltransferase [Romeria aff. gracilis LEGE 07310]|uniref:Adenine phosphoribosyltransferase n=1 Tax=Vasconcelosia minhoensis LEGE 07310 TaxID=915328 RepID=A0A8J7A9E0_9CYAN|nr:adenine phosphoribosyltransferase [Romeria gracilis]MBE9078565.1 adenine phosphoribosyltransferase [Romeria aff. gracilis LEGE 07310]
MDLKALIRDVPDFPKPGIMYRDITTLLKNSEGLSYTLDQMAAKATELAPDVIVGIESRGFIFGMPLAYKLGKSFAPVRKSGKLPAPVHAISYDLEYGQDRLEVHQDAFTAGSRVLIVDDLLATGGTAAATAQLIQQMGAEIAGFSFVIELAGLQGRQKLPGQASVSSLVVY